MSGCARVNRLQSLLADYERVLASIPACLMGLLMPYKQRVENALRPGLTTHSWLAVGINDCESVTRFDLGYCLLQNCGLNRLNKTRMRVIAALPSTEVSSLLSQFPVFTFPCVSSHPTLLVSPFPVFFRPLISRYPFLYFPSLIHSLPFLFFLFLLRSLPVSSTFLSVDGMGLVWHAAGFATKLRCSGYLLDVLNTNLLCCHS